MECSSPGLEIHAVFYSLTRIAQHMQGKRLQSPGPSPQQGSSGSLQAPTLLLSALVPGRTGPIPRSKRLENWRQSPRSNPTAARLEPAPRTRGPRRDPQQPVTEEGSPGPLRLSAALSGGVLPARQVPPAALSQLLLGACEFQTRLPIN
nr:uncharacterized protein LOC129048192 isoform X2 [Pongo abelii]